MLHVQLQALSNAASKALQGRRSQLCRRRSAPSRSIQATAWTRCRGKTQAMHEGFQDGYCCFRGLTRSLKLWRAVLPAEQTTQSHFSSLLTSAAGGACAWPGSPEECSSKRSFRLQNFQSNHHPKPEFTSDWDGSLNELRPVSVPCNLGRVAFSNSPDSFKIDQSNDETAGQRITNSERSSSFRTTLRTHALDPKPSKPRELESAARERWYWPCSTLEGATGVMAENSPELANLRDLPSKPRPDPRSSKTGVSGAARPKRPFLKRGVGTQARITATQRKKYVPKGGFVLNLDEEQGLSKEGPQKSPNRQEQSSSAAGPRTATLQPVQTSTVQRPGWLAAASPATDATAHDNARTCEIAALGAAHSENPSTGATHGPADADAAHHLFHPNSQAQPESLLDTDGDALEMHSETEMLLGSKCNATTGLAMVGGPPCVPASPSTDPIQAQEVSDRRESSCMCQPPRNNHFVAQQISTYHIQTHITLNHSWAPGTDSAGHMSRYAMKQLVQPCNGWSQN